MTVPSQLTALNAGTTPWYGVQGAQGTYLGIINQLNNTIGQITGVLAEYGQTSLTEVHQLHDAEFLNYPTIVQMEEYVQSIAMTGVDPSTIGNAYDLVSINATGNGFVGIPQPTFVTTAQYSPEHEAVLSELDRMFIATMLFESMYFY